MVRPLLSSRGGDFEGELPMRILFSLLLLAPLLLLGAPQASIADSRTKISWGQMVDACGGNNSSGGGHVGCTAKCGSHWCDYDCYGTGNCYKTVVAIVSRPPNDPVIAQSPAAGLSNMPPPSLSTSGSGGGGIAPSQGQQSQQGQSGRPIGAL